MEAKRTPLLVSAENEAKIQQASDILSTAGVIAIIRAKNPDVAIARGIELANMGCKALEVTWDSVDKGRILSELVKAVGNRCLVGVGTVEHVDQVEECARLGARFALSPINPGGMIDACHAKGVLAMPAAFSPQEIHNAWMAGARAIKIFPAQLWSPSLLKQVMNIGSFGKMCLCPSGGITPANAQAWIDAGATAVGMGSNLAGKDIGVTADKQAALKVAQGNWAKTGKAAAQAIIAQLGPNGTGAAKL